MAYVGPFPITVADGGTGASTFTSFGLLAGSGTGAIAALGVGATGTVLTGSTGADPVFTGSPSVSGTVTAGTGVTATTGAITATAGNVAITAGNLLLPNTNTAGTAGVIEFGGTRWISNFGTNCTFLGAVAGNTTTTADNCVAVGNQAGISLTNDVDTTLIGTNAGYWCEGTTNCTYIGANSGPNLSSGSSGSYNTGVGNDVLTHISTGGSNVAIGTGSATSALDLITTGSFNTAIGYNAGYGYTSSESSNISINAQGTAGESNTLRISATGTGNGQISKAFIGGIYGVTTTSGTTSAVLVSNGDQLGTVSSSLRFKENVKDMDSGNFMKLRPVNFNFKSDKGKTKQYGLIAEEVDKIMPDIVNYDDEGKPFAVRYHDLPAILLHEIQKLQKRIDVLEKR
jgi:hypothetical protein